MMEEIKIIKKTVVETKEEIGDIKKENAFLRGTVNDLKREIANLNNRLEVLEKYSRKGNVIINGIPFERDENVRALTKTFANEIGVDLEEYQIGAAHRLPTKGKIPPIIVKFNDYDKKIELIKKTKRARPTIGDRPIFVEDHLMAKTTAILKEAKRMRQEEKLKYVWIRGGEVFVRKSDNDPAIKISQMEELNSIGGTKRSLVERSPEGNTNESRENCQVEKMAKITSSSQGQQTILDGFRTQLQKSTGSKRGTPKATHSPQKIWK